MANKERQKKIHGLTKRELEVLAILAEGYSYDDAAKILFIERTTLVTHLNNIFSTLPLPYSDRTNAVLYYHRKIKKDHLIAELKPDEIIQSLEKAIDQLKSLTK